MKDYRIGFEAGLKRLAPVVVVLLLLVPGCSRQAAREGKREVVPAAVTAPRAGAGQKEANGSLWDEKGSLCSMFADMKARKVGDILTIKIIETSSATNKASTKAGRDSSLSAGLGNFFNAEKRYPGDQPFFNPFGKVAGSMKSEFDGSGTTKRSGALTAYMTARIKEVLPNGNLLIEGNREVRVNDENQVITLTGIIRPRDISADNVIKSTYIADARISYSGSGIINDRQRPGWLSRLLNKIWPF